MQYIRVGLSHRTRACDSVPTVQAGHRRSTYSIRANAAGTASVVKRRGRYKTLTDFLASLSPDVTVQSIDGRRAKRQAGDITTPAHLRRTEHDEQVAFVTWARENHAAHPELRNLFAVPNGAKLPYTVNANGERHSRQGAHLRAEGLEAGVPDLLLAVARCGFHGLFLEMKRKGNKPTAEQLDWHARLKAEGYAVVIPYSAEEAREYTLAYLTGHFTQ